MMWSALYKGFSHLFRELGNLNNTLDMQTVSYVNFVGPSELGDSLVRGSGINFYYQAVPRPDKPVRLELGIRMRKLF